MVLTTKGSLCAEFEEKKKQQPDLLTDEERKAKLEQMKSLEERTEHVQALQEENKALQEKAKENRQKVENGEITNAKELQQQTKERTEEQNRIESNAESLGEDDPGTKQTTSYSKTMEEGINSKLGADFNGAVVPATTEKQVVQTPAVTTEAGDARLAGKRQISANFHTFAA